VIDVPVEMRGEDIFLMQGDRRYRIRGLNKNMSYELLKVNVLVSGKTPRGESAFHVDTLDLYSARQRGVFTKQAGEELGLKEEVVRRDLGRVLLKLEELQDEQIKRVKPVSLFFHKIDDLGVYQSVCHVCYLIVAEDVRESELKPGEDHHQCKGKPRNQLT
jgi:hypothetical protein